uniref:Diguanylate cyclase/phosphodiesterase (GGDEF & EAL domains) with PAS/PAC sensor(S) n=1 Tax=uncultured Nocardioidaceae bacterium TaxID=253824 RepID=A0A6J4KL06_9ACTN|nr:MAG: diguanylate cyclase/phosphodiesterase (GGDEF & EAL domains) with PAS/PAC sensor(s) [uncultured Nocardioidaceae bacterium]
MSRDARLAEVLVEFAHTLGTDFSLNAILDRLVLRVVDVLPVTGAGVMLMEPDAELHFVAGSNKTIFEIEALQRDFDEGPCLEAYRTGRAVAIPDLSVDQRFPKFSPRALAAGLEAVFTFPLRLDEHRLGALDLYRDTPGSLSPGDSRAAQILADVAAAYLFNAHSRQVASDTLASVRHHSLHDPLTGLANRTLFAELLDHAVASARRSHLPVAVLFVDLDRFKLINDRFGHHVGDLMLLSVADRLTQQLRPGDTLARFAGDEFVILCENLSHPTDAERLAERVVSAFVEPFEVNGRSIEMSASVGIAFSGPGEDVPESLLHDADFAMYEAKASGGASYRVVNRATLFEADRRAHVEGDLPVAFRRGELDLAYQPLTQSHDGTLVGVEALLRWNHPKLGPVPPITMIPLAERSGLILSLGEWVLRQACRDFVRWNSTHGSAVGHVAVNVSARQIMGPDFSTTVARIIDDTGMDPACLHLEVTESLLLDDIARAQDTLSAVKTLGVQLSLDDFGTGYSSLTYLQSIPFDTLKIDRSIIAHIADDQPAASAIVNSIIGLARALDLTVVAEGVETREQRIRSAELGCDLAQGFHLSPPLPTAELEHQLLDHASNAPIRLPLAG